MADQKLSQLTQKTTLAAADQIYVIDPSSKRLTVSDLTKNFGPNNLLTPPIDAQFTWVNQAGASVSSSDVGIAMIIPAGGGDSWRCREKIAPTPPYTITALLSHFGTGGFGGLAFRNSGAGTLAGIFPYYFSTLTTSRNSVYVRKQTSPTVVSADYISDQNIASYEHIWIRIQDTGVNRISSLSKDGINFVQIHSVGRTDFLTADRILWFGNNQNLATFTTIFTLRSWKEENV